MNVRYPVAAGSFYEQTAASCRHHAQRLLQAAALPDDLPVPLPGGLAPHAGWVFSGDLAALTVKALAAGRELSTVVLFGADHTGGARRGEVFPAGAWRTPLGEAPVDEDLAAALLAHGDLLRANDAAHAREHSLEVQVPLLQAAAPAVRIVPITVPPTDLAVRIGQAVAEVLAARGTDVPILGSTDLTHHGGHFGSPGGRGRAGEQWTRANDRRMIDRIEALDAEGVIAEAEQRGNACGAGAVAAAIAACRQLGASKGRLLQYTNSYEVVHQMVPDDPDDTTVGYASVVFV